MDIWNKLKNYFNCHGGRIELQTAHEKRYQGYVAIGITVIGVNVVDINALLLFLKFFL